jgi:REP element-mobilizing transposase RayT
LGRIFKTIAKWKGLVITAWHIGDHNHLVIDIPPKYSISYIIKLMFSSYFYRIAHVVGRINTAVYFAGGILFTKLALSAILVSWIQIYNRNT